MGFHAGGTMTPAPASLSKSRLALGGKSVEEDPEFLGRSPGPALSVPGAHPPSSPSAKGQNSNTNHH